MRMVARGMSRAFAPVVERVPVRTSVGCGVMADPPLVLATGAHRTPGPRTPCRIRRGPRARRRRRRARRPPHRRRLARGAPRSPTSRASGSSSNTSFAGCARASRRPDPRRSARGVRGDDRQRRDQVPALGTRRRHPDHVVVRAVVETVRAARPRIRDHRLVVGPRGRSTQPRLRTRIGTGWLTSGQEIADAAQVATEHGHACQPWTAAWRCASSPARIAAASSPSPSPRATTASAL